MWIKRGVLVFRIRQNSNWLRIDRKPDHFVVPKSDYAGLKLRTGGAVEVNKKPSLRLRR